MLVFAFAVAFAVAFVVAFVFVFVFVCLRVCVFVRTAWVLHNITRLNEIDRCLSTILKINISHNTYEVVIFRYRVYQVEDDIIGIEHVNKYPIHGTWFTENWQST